MIRAANRWWVALVAVLPAVVALPSSAAEATPHRARELLAKARAAVVAENEPVALELLEQAIDHDVDLLEAYRLAIPMWIAAGELGTLRRRLERVTVRHPSFAGAWYALGYAYRLQGRVDLAVPAYQSYIGLRPGEAAPYFGLATSYKLLGRKRRAESAFRRYLNAERDPLRADFVDHARRQLVRLVWHRLVSRWFAGAVSATRID